ncbi:MAG: peptidylprolyl isomerase [Deltaproteobacteria bacterium]|jgi:peptidyl-prolyl cis-trans isomerase A (cyclophilin A)|nr:peptidylprolyl isomerase [Deltaproteobacteria bacterium]MBW2530606.1 peptidylprolyl isomerase [Deltaproteobacteria bacterium]
MGRASRRQRATRLASGLTLALALPACDPGAPQGRTSAPVPSARYDPDWKATENRKRPEIKQVDASLYPPPRVTARPTPSIRPSPDDPLGGRFSLEDATRGLPAGGRLIARIETSMGVLTCELWPDEAPLATANFLGLARGLRPWKTPEGRWESKPAYDDTTLHRVIPGFAIQGGSPTARADWQPGYAIPDEIWDGANHDRAGLLGMVTPTKHTGGMQFYVTDGPTPQLDGSYPIFGSCGPRQLIGAIARVEAQRGRPVVPVQVERVQISRRAAAVRQPR